ncbi:hypothetical protein CHS0354_025639 [Potamilus streckersoni]|uniref:Uncharacterized protein n=1 Tax=Potamilus streckersoni TaxID=2493646 RepID=A0AAE0S180_9BIVA|nr:hypothetical protein CHS0354_025639 [Potamilus streckersoni]
MDLGSVRENKFDHHDLKLSPSGARVSTINQSGHSDTGISHQEEALSQHYWTIGINTRGDFSTVPARDINVELVEFIEHAHTDLVQSDETINASLQNQQDQTYPLNLECLEILPDSAEFEEHTDPILSDQKRVKKYIDINPSNPVECNKYIHPVSSDPIDLGGYIDPIPSDAMGLNEYLDLTPSDPVECNDYIHPIFSNPLDLGGYIDPIPFDSM